MQTILSQCDPGEAEVWDEYNDLVPTKAAIVAPPFHEDEWRLIFRIAVLRGERWLDEVYPEWYTHINTTSLDLSMGQACILGQIAFGSLRWFEERKDTIDPDTGQFSYERTGRLEADIIHGFSAFARVATAYLDDNPEDEEWSTPLANQWMVNHGFNLPDGNPYYRVMSDQQAWGILTEEWVHCIRSRCAQWTMARQHIDHDLEAMHA